MFKWIWYVGEQYATLNDFCTSKNKFVINYGTFKRISNLLHCTCKFNFISFTRMAEVVRNFLSSQLIYGSLINIDNKNQNVWILEMNVMVHKVVQILLAMWLWENYPLYPSFPLYETGMTRTWYIC